MRIGLVGMACMETNILVSAPLIMKTVHYITPKCATCDKSNSRLKLIFAGIGELVWWRCVSEAG